jgi:hypothetical protein
VKKYAQTQTEMVERFILRKKPRAWSDDSDSCSYSHAHNGGCAIGVEIRRGLAEELAQQNHSARENLNKLPPRLQKMGTDFLTRIQLIHDTRMYYNESNEIVDGFIWNLHGQRAINGLIDRFELNIKPL